MLSRLTTVIPHFFLSCSQHLTSLFHPGTAGVWRISVVNEAGGWKDRTTVEDMDLAIRASLKGWKFVYLGDVQVQSIPIMASDNFRYHPMHLSALLSLHYRRFFFPRQ